MHTLTRHATLARTAIATLLSAIAMGTHAAAPAQGTKVYRCTQADGRVTYSQQACAHDADTLDVRDKRSAQQVSDAKDTHERERALAKRQARERRKMERAGAETPAKALTVASVAAKSNKADKAKDPRAPVPFEPAEHVERKRHFRAVVPKAATSQATAKATS